MEYDTRISKRTAARMAGTTITMLNKDIADGKIKPPTKPSPGVGSWPWYTLEEVDALRVHFLKRLKGGADRIARRKAAGLYTVAEISEMIGVATPAIYYAMNHNRIPKPFRVLPGLPGHFYDATAVALIRKTFHSKIGWVKGGGGRPRGPSKKATA